MTLLCCCFLFLAVEKLYCSIQSCLGTPRAQNETAFVKPGLGLCVSVSSNLSCKSPFYHGEGQAYKSFFSRDGDLLEEHLGCLRSQLPQGRSPAINTFPLHSDISAQNTVSSAVIHTWPAALGSSQGRKQSQFSTLRIFFSDVSHKNQKAEVFQMDMVSKFWSQAQASGLFCDSLAWEIGVKLVRDDFPLAELSSC